MLHLVDELMPIGEFSGRSGLSQKRLRSYAAEGLLVPAAVDPASGYRYYSPGQLHEAQVIDALRQAGLSLADIRVGLSRPSTEFFATRRRNWTATHCNAGKRLIGLAGSWLAKGQRPPKRRNGGP